MSFHKAACSGTINLASTDAVTCICNEGEQGFINGNKFSKDCLDEPYGDLVRQKNPSCTIETYSGGLHCCKNGYILLD